MALVLAFIVSCAVCFVLGVYQGSARDDALGVREILKLPEGCPPQRECPPAPLERSDLEECPPCVTVKCRACPACDPCPARAIAERTERNERRVDADANNRSVDAATAASSDEDVGVEDDIIVSAKDESERRARDSETMTTKSVRADDATGAIGGDECPVCEGCPKCDGETCPDAPTCGDASQGTGTGTGTETGTGGCPPCDACPKCASPGSPCPEHEPCERTSE